MSIVAQGVGMETATVLLQYLCQKGVIYKDDKVWRPAAGFADKNLFGYDSFNITSKGITSKLIHTIKVTFKGKCFIRVLLSHPELEPMDAYLKTFTKEII